MLNGFLNLNKSKGMTSSKAIAKLKYILIQAGHKPDKIGHMGTLDPDGEGVLPVALGRGTRLFDYFIDKKKVYYAEFSFGAITDTLDASGETIGVTEVIPSKQDLKNVLPLLCGHLAQVPPLYSAKVIGGTKAYKLARAGKEVQLQPKTVDIYDIKLLEQLETRVFSFRIECGGGTYIRSIARDMAAAVGSLGYMRYIKRLQSGVFTIEQAYTLEELADGSVFDKIIPLEEVCRSFPVYHAPDSLAEKIYHGVKVEADGMPKGNFALYIEGKLAGIAYADCEGRLIYKTRLI
ncbi:MAG: tRNA pseudouridine(55) synthase TruB [Clostridia bacterium]|nr:tRNA pseudouridine(55) synthase TruB [Clostridia bacterium]